MRVKVAFVTANSYRSSVIKGTARVRVEMRTPTVRPLPAIPSIEPIVVLDMHYARSPMVVDVDVIEADVIVIEVMPPTPFVWTPPRMAPCSQPTSGRKSETESDSPVVREAHSETIR